MYNPKNKYINRRCGRFGQEVLSVVELNLMHPEWLDVTVNSLLFAILNVFQALMHSRGYNLIAVKPWSTQQRPIVGLDVNDIEFSRRFQASGLQV
jgi:hypothetical protein